MIKTEVRCQKTEVRGQKSDVRFLFSVFCFLSSVFCLLSSGILWAQETPPEETPRAPVVTKQTVEKWVYSHYDKDTLYWQAQSEVADIIGQKEIEAQVKKIIITYYLSMEKGVTTPTDKFVVLSADEGYIKQKDNSGVFSKNVHLVMPPDADSKSGEPWHLLANTINLRSFNAKEGKREIIITSDEVVTLTSTASITITATSMKAAVTDTTLHSNGLTRKQQSKKVIFNSALLVRSLPLRADEEKPRLLQIKSDTMELCDPSLEEEIILLKGKKEVLLYNPAQFSVGVNGENAKLKPLPCIWITSEGNAFIHPRFYEITFKDKVQTIQSFSVPLDKTPVTATSVSSPKGTLSSDNLTILLEPETNEIKKALAEGNVILVNDEGKVASGETLDWTPQKHLIIIKSGYEVRVWADNNSSVAEEVSIHTAANSTQDLMHWEKIEMKKGRVKIVPPKELDK